MNTIERNPDIDIDFDEIPAGFELVHGKNLMHTARAKKIPFGVARTANHSRGQCRRETVGLIIRTADVEMFRVALAAKDLLRGNITGGQA
jgi:hypothetical protein